MVIRLYNFDDSDAEMDLSLWKSFKSAFKTNLIEEEEETLKLNRNDLHMGVGHHEITTIKFK